MTDTGHVRSDAADEALVVELQATRAVTEAVLAHSSDLVTFFDADGTIRWVSSAVSKIFGVDPSELIGCNGFDLIHPEDRARVQADFASIPDLDDCVLTEFRIMIGGAVRWVEEIFTNLVDEPNVGRIVGNLRDVTERKAAADALLLHGTLLAAAGQAIVASDNAGRVLYWNDAAEALYGWSAEDAIGERLQGLVPLAPGSGPLPAGAFDLFGGAPWTGELRVVARSGREVPVRATSRPVFDAEGEPIAITIVSYDITDQLRDQETAARLSAIVESSNDAIFSADPQGAITTWNDGAARLYERSAEEALGSDLSSLAAPDDDGRLLGCFEQVLAGGGPGALVTKGLGAEGRTLDVAVSMSPIRTDTGALVGVSAIAQDVTDRVQQRQRDDDARRHLAEAQASARLGSFEIDLATGDVTRSAELWRLIGLEPGTVTGVDYEHIHPEDRAAVEAAFDAAAAGATDVACTHRIVRPDGTIRWVLSRTRTAVAPGSTLLAGTMIDVTERHEAELALAHQASHDPLTGLANRRLLVEELERSLERSASSQTSTAVLYLDLDDFKTVNDRLGHVDGDEVLRAVGERLVRSVEPGDTVARLGGDEFVVCCDGVVDPEDLERRVGRVQRALLEPSQHGVDTVTLAVSIGVASSRSSSRPERLLREADAAMYEAKQGGGSRIAVFDDVLDAEGRRRRQLTADLDAALDTGQIQTYFQPEVAMATGTLLGFEALARWQHPEHGTVSPVEFIELAERSRAIGRLGRKVLSDACAALAAWADRLPEQRLSVAVNVSPVQLADPAFPGHVRDALQTAGVPAGRLCLEVTESTLMDSDLATSALRELKAIGVTIAIDDFGTGYSSLSRLKRFPVDVLKVDQTFVDGLGSDPEDEVIVATVINLARSLGLDVVAEGVETTTQLDLLAGLGCERGQGYLWSPALDLAGATAYAAGEVALQHADPAASGTRVPSSRQTRTEEHQATNTMAAIVHELATPLTVIRGYADLARYLPAPDDGQMLDAALGAIGRSADDMATIMQTMKDVRSIEEGTLVLDLRPLDVVRLLSEMIAERAMADTTNPVSLGVSDSVEVVGDATRCRQIFTNLLANAATWSPAGAPIEILVDVAPATASVTIVDRGPGVAADSVGELFRMFARPDRTHNGTGLGLYVARSLARSQGGDIRYRRSAAGGSEFIVDLPRCRPDDAM